MRQVGNKTASQSSTSVTVPTLGANLHEATFNFFHLKRVAAEDKCHEESNFLSVKLLIYSKTKTKQKQAQLPVKLSLIRSNKS
jgi:hypothetical protein